MSKSAALLLCAAVAACREPAPPPAPAAPPKPPPPPLGELVVGERLPLELDHNRLILQRFSAGPLAFELVAEPCVEGNQPPCAMAVRLLDGDNVIDGQLLDLASAPGVADVKPPEPDAPEQVRGWRTGPADPESPQATITTARAVRTSGGPGLLVQQSTGAGTVTAIALLGVEGPKLRRAFSLVRRPAGTIRDELRVSPLKDGTDEILIATRSTELAPPPDDTGKPLVLSALVFSRLVPVDGAVVQQPTGPERRVWAAVFATPPDTREARAFVDAHEGCLPRGYGVFGPAAFPAFDPRKLAVALVTPVEAEAKAAVQAGKKCAPGRVVVASQPR